MRQSRNNSKFKTQNSKLKSRFPQMFHDHSDLLCQQIFCLFAVTGLVEVVHQRFALVDPSHQVVHRYLGFAVRKIEHGQFGLTVTFYLKHNGWVFIVFVCHRATNKYGIYVSNDGCYWRLRRLSTPHVMSVFRAYAAFGVRARQECQEALQGV